ncbi:hypothetical protein BABINDRAFT_32396 [Babjeviella inositovora NRRL Y-12698]|uniref:Phosphatidic acid phosphatase type 2/haloperoxidase domain-containing protein n=1 Tax=Babjeviella inositovora NRRL Y-12698 TaxID=984486 RepID=A0A1E3QXH5_9ASCO|nr:uncharacterized protein BABINDRAFT_32396 [Babjeviella inositovora NRRL Y-12698]ODQ81772.1 hypothetical protein BABINDRAFT_32396 [Babjeviella inositovora NRRL Y-12698]
MSTTKAPTPNRVTFGLERIPLIQFCHLWKVGDLLLTAFLSLVYFFHKDNAPFERQFYLGDMTISHPFAETERVSNTMLFVYSMVLPVCVITVVSLLVTPKPHKVKVTYLSLVALLVSFFVCTLVTGILKNVIGRHRPDFLARCIPKEGTPLLAMVYAKDVCTTKNISRLQEGFRTTPSGHSSYSWAGLGFLSLWLYGQMALSQPGAGSWRAILAWVPSFGAALIAISRTEDYRHHFVDVILGSILGMSIAWWSYRRCFPEVTRLDSHIPYIVAQELSLSAEEQGYTQELFEENI